MRVVRIYAAVDLLEENIIYNRQKPRASVDYLPT
jgi:hypothetical protein